MYKGIVGFIRNIYGGRENIPLHEPCFSGREKKYVSDTIDTSFVSSVGEYVNRFERDTAAFCGAKFAVATVNGTAALHIALKLSGTKANDEVLTQPLTFVATANAISYTGALPVFIDVDRDTLGLSSEKLADFLKANAVLRKGGAFNRKTGRRISACVPMHTFGHPCRIDEIAAVCRKYKIALVEDAAESIGSLYKGKHTGLFSKVGILSFNGNKIITTGGGGMIITDDANFAKKAKHITTTAKIPHKWEYVHDETGYNYRLPNLNAALGCAQLEQLDGFLRKKRKLAAAYAEYFKGAGIPFVLEPEHARSNYWLNAILLKNRAERNKFLLYSNSNGVMTRPAWRLMNKLKMYRSCQCADLENSNWLEDRIVNIPSSVKK
ncbi:MAG TPA: LegC family aminotransferase [Lentisphaeria bacterium]|nr:MAG: aminotransferase DegT [Lentisphaerae bacterium GWF2_50_93]HCE45636.1 LegC family aminotransferase [Lentisphaeria bacterium]